MKKGFMNHIIIFIALIIILLVIDYINLPTLLGFELSNINWDFCMGIINAIVVVMLYLFTYKVIDERTVHRENNKTEISMLLIRNCYLECLEYIKILNQEIVEKYIVSKIDFDSTDNTIICNLQNTPFQNESTILDLVKDGQLTKNQIEGYFQIKAKFRQYVNMRIVFFEAEQLYYSLKIDLCDTINNEVKKIDELI